MKIGVIGTGHIAAPMVRHLVRAGHDVTISQRNAQVAAALTEALGIAALGNQDVLDACDTVLLCLRPAVAETVLAPLRFHPDHSIVSVMAGVPAQSLRALCAPATRMVQTIPMPFIDQGGCPLPALGDADVLAALFAPENPVFPVQSEDAFNAHFAAATLVPAVLEALNTGAEWLGQATGDLENAERYTTALVAGYLSALPQQTGILAWERDALATPNTLSLQMVEAMRATHLPGALRHTFDTIQRQLG